MNDSDIIYFIKYGNHSSNSYIRRINYYRYELCIEQSHSIDTITIYLSRYDIKLLSDSIEKISLYNNKFCCNVVNSINIKDGIIKIKNREKKINILFSFSQEKDSKSNITGRVILKTEFFHKMSIFGKIKYLKPIEIKFNREQVVDFIQRINTILI